MEGQAGEFASPRVSPQAALLVGGKADGQWRTLLKHPQLVVAVPNEPRYARVEYLENPMVSTSIVSRAVYNRHDLHIDGDRRSIYVSADLKLIEAIDKILINYKVPDTRGEAK